MAIALQPDLRLPQPVRAARRALGVVLLLAVWALHLMVLGSAADGSKPTATTAMAHALQTRAPLADAP